MIETSFSSERQSRDHSGNLPSLSRPQLRLLCLCARIARRLLAQIEWNSLSRTQQRQVSRELSKLASDLTLSGIILKARTKNAKRKRAETALAGMTKKAVSRTERRER